MNILVTAFDGINNSSCMLIKQLNSKCEKLILKNDKTLSKKQLYSLLNKINFNLILMFGQKPLIKNKVAIETTAMSNSEKLYTIFNCDEIKDFFNKNGYTAYLSNNAGTSYCNYIYYSCMKYTIDNNYQAKPVFIHIPYRENINDEYKLINIIDEYILLNY